MYTDSLLRFELHTQVIFKLALRSDELDISTVLDDELVSLELLVLLTVNVGEAPLAADNDLLAAGELVSGTAQSLLDDRSVAVLASNRHDDLSNVDAGDGAVGLSPGATHTSLETISSSATQHLVDTNDVERMGTHAEMEGILSSGLGHILVRANAGCFEGFTGKLFVLIGNEMAAERKVVDGGALTTEIVDSNLGIRYTAIVPRLRVRLVFTIAIASSWSTTHGSNLVS